MTGERPGCARRWSAMFAWPLFAASLLLGVSLAPASARAADAPATLLDWRAPEACPDARAVDASLSAVLGQPATDFGRFSRVSGTIEPRGTGWLLTIELIEDGQRSNRLINAERCEDLAEAAAVAIALALEQQRERSTATSSELDRDESRGAGEPNAATSVAAATPSDTVDVYIARSSPERTTYRLAFGADAVMDVSSLPRLAPGVGMHASLEHERWHFALYGAFLPPRELSLAAQQGVDFSLLAGGARACFSALAQALFPAVCAGLELGRFSADGEGLSDARRADNLWLAPTAGLELSPELWRGLSLDVRADALVPLIRKHYAVNDGERVFRPPPATLRLYLGLTLAID